MNIKRTCLSLLCVSVLALGTFRAADSSAQREVMAAEKARTEAFVQHDIAALDKLLRDDLTYTHASGRVDNKKMLLDAIRSDELHYVSWTPREIHARISGDTAVLNGEYAVKVINRSASQEMLDLNIFFLSVYVHTNGRWQQIAWQSTRDVGK